MFESFPAGPRHALFALLLSVGCSAPSANVPDEVKPAGTESAEAKPSPVALPPATEDEQRVQSELEGELQGLLKLGERAFADDGMALASATDHVAARLESFGYEVKRRGFSQGDVIAQNLEAEVSGLRRGNQLVIVAARLDANPTSPGADDNATGVAALLTLARHFQGKHSLRTLRFVCLSSAGPRTERTAQGAAHYATTLEADGTEVVAVLELNGLGYFTNEPGSQRYPGVIPSHDFGEFIALVSQPEAANLADTMSDAFARRTSIPFVHWRLVRDDTFLEYTAAREFIERGFPTLLLTDTGTLRNSEFGTANDEISRLDTDRMARVVVALQDGISALVGPQGERPEPTSEGLLGGSGGAAPSAP